MEKQVPVPQKQTVQPLTQCALSLASASASATSQEMRSAGEEGRVFVAHKGQPQTRMALNREAMGNRVKSRGLAALTRIVQPRIPSALSLDSASANATSLEMLSAGAKETAYAVQTKEEQIKKKEELIKKKEELIKKKEELIKKKEELIKKKEGLVKKEEELI